MGHAGTATARVHPPPAGGEAGAPGPDGSRTVAHLDSQPGRTPLLAVDLEVVLARHRQVSGMVPAARLFYAIKANPHPAVLDLLVRSGSAFDVASLPEIRACLAAGAGPDALSFGNTVKKQRDVAEAHRLGVRRFAFDSATELAKLVVEAPGSTAFCRIAGDCRGAAWPLSGKFGCSADEAVGLLEEAARNGLRTGVSFHPGSQQTDPSSWDRHLAVVARIRSELASRSVDLHLVNLGGGLPGRYRGGAPPLSRYGDAVSAAIERHLGPVPPPEIMMEPGRALVADAGVLRTEVVAVTRRGSCDDARWVYLDVGVFSGLVETMDEAIRYRIEPAGRRIGRAGAVPCEPALLAGPTCDSADVLYTTTPYMLPADLAAGDLLDIHAAGAYTATYSTVGFNGFEPPAIDVLPVRVAW